jgi:hypothetical protein
MPLYRHEERQIPVYFVVSNPVIGLGEYKVHIPCAYPYYRYIPFKSSKGWEKSPRVEPFVALWEF